MNSGFFSIDSELTLLHQQLRKSWPALRRIAVALHDPQTGMLHAFAQSGEEPGFLHTYSTPLKAATSLLALSETGESRIIADLTALKNADTAHSRAIVRSGYKSSFTLPLYLHGQLLGFVFYDASQTDYFSTKLQKELTEYTHLIESMVISEILPLQMIVGIIRAAEKMTSFKNEETGKHSVRTAYYIELIASQMADQYALSDEEIKYMWLFTPLHDIGKIGVPDDILTKPARLDAHEYAVIQQHVDEGLKIAESLIPKSVFQRPEHADILRAVIGTHHERWNGSGYPRAIKGTDIPIIGRMTAVADVYDALTSRRSYKQGFGAEDAFAFLEDHRALLFDPDCVNAFIGQKEKVLEIQQKFIDDAMY